MTQETDTRDTRDRVIRLETEMRALSAEVRDVAGKVDTMYELLTKARGIGWLGVTLLSFGGGLGAMGSWLVQKFFASVS